MITWDERYSEPDYVYGTDPNDFLVEAEQFIPKDGPVLSLAEGEGRNAVFLAKQGFDVTGVDSSRVGLQKAQNLARQAQVQINTLFADLSGFTIEPKSWSAIVSIFCHLPPPIRKRLHAQVVQGLRPGGVYILESYTPRQLEYKTGGPPVAELMMEKDEVIKELPGLTILRAEELVRDVMEGKLHHGRAAVLQVIARRDA